MKIIFNSQKDKDEYMLRIIYLLYALINLGDNKDAIALANNLIIMAENSEVKKK